MSKDEKEKNEIELQKAFEGGKQELKLDEFEPIVTNVAKLPNILKMVLFDRIKVAEKLDKDADKIPKQSIINFWKKHLEHETVKRRVFKILAKYESNVLVPDDFKPLFAYLLKNHPGLEFLQATPEFQERYADTVVMRIFFSLDSNDDGKITWRDFKNSNLCDTFF